MTTFAPEWTHGRLTATAAASVLGSVHVDGVLATRVTLPASAVITIPTGWSFEEACTLPCAGLTAWHALFEESTHPTDAPVLTIGSGGVSVFALQFARRAGCDVVAVSSRAEKLRALARLGATATIDRTTTPAWGEAAKSLTGEGVAHVIDVGGQGTLSQSIRATRPGGTISLVGTLARPTPVDLTPVLMRNLRIQGVVAGSRDMLQRMLATLDADSPRPVIDRVFDFAEAPAAFDYLAEGRHVGKVIIGIQPC
jgi:NADPH:quinone reductase-like Zn-dependent oxidoreductase